MIYYKVVINKNTLDNYTNIKNLLTIINPLLDLEVETGGDNRFFEFPGP